jgi:hypothetical protein
VHTSLTHISERRELTFHVEVWTDFALHTHLKAELKGIQKMQLLTMLLRF